MAHGKRLLSALMKRSGSRNEPKHTPGPWEASEGYPSDIWHVDMPGRAFSVSVSRHGEDWDMPVEEVEANARLMAASPELFDAVEHVLIASEDGGDMDDIDFNMLRKAFAKAGGK